jgi:molybdate transport system regulatory protein
MRRFAQILFVLFQNLRNLRELYKKHIFDCPFKSNYFMKISHILKNPSDFSVVGKLWVFSKEDRFFGPGRLELLEQIEKTGSINKAAKAMNMSYKKAWEMVNSMNRQTLKPLIVTQTGGKEGGGAVITEEAVYLIAFFKEMHQRFQDFLSAESKNIVEL